jgi:hypothetical protein
MLLNRVGQTLERARVILVDGIEKPRAGLSETDDAEDIPDFEPFDPMAFLVRKALE